MKFSQRRTITQLPCGCRVYWRGVLDSCSKGFLSVCWPCRSGSPTLVQCQGLQLWWCWSLSGRCSVFSGHDAECFSRAGTEKQIGDGDFRWPWHIWTKLKCSHSNGRRSHNIPEEPWLPGQTTPPPASRVGAHPSAVWAGGRGPHLHRNPWLCKAGSHLLPKTPCTSQCWDVAAEKEAAPPALQTAALAWRRWSNSAS